MNFQFFYTHYKNQYEDTLILYSEIMFTPVHNYGYIKQFSDKSQILLWQIEIIF